MYFWFQVILVVCALQLVVFLGGPLVGALMDSMPRVFAFTFLSFMQVDIQFFQKVFLMKTKRMWVLGLKVLTHGYLFDARQCLYLFRQRWCCTPPPVG